MAEPASSEHEIVFIHGLWIHSAAWAPWLEYFSALGYRVSAPGWPGDAETVDATRANPDALNDVGIEAVVAHYAALIGAMPERPVVIGHSFGGLIAEELLAQGLAVAAVAIDAAPIKGVRTLPFAQLKSSFPVLSNPANKKRTVMLTEKQFRYAFGNAVSEEESADLYARWAIPGPGRPLFEDATANFSRTSPAAVDTHLAARGPLLLTAGTEDHTVPQSVVKAVFALYDSNPDAFTDYHEFEGRGHSLTIDSGWGDVADIAAAWLRGQGL